MNLSTQEGAFQRAGVFNIRTQRAVQDIFSNMSESSSSLGTISYSQETYQGQSSPTSSVCYPVEFGGNVSVPDLVMRAEEQHILDMESFDIWVNEAEENNRLLLQNEFWQDTTPSSMLRSRTNRSWFFDFYIDSDGHWHEIESEGFGYMREYTPDEELIDHEFGSAQELDEVLLGEYEAEQRRLWEAEMLEAMPDLVFEQSYDGELIDALGRTEYDITIAQHNAAMVRQIMLLQRGV